MAFALIEARYLEAASGRASVRSWRRSTYPLPLETADTSRRALWLAMIAASHLAAFWMLPTIRTQAPLANELAPLIVVDVADNQQTSVSPSPTESAANPPTLTPPDQLSTEWSTSRIPAPVMTEPTPVAPAQTMSAAPSPPGTAAPSGYDPYAGVAPLRQASLAAPIPNANPASPTKVQDHPIGPATISRLANTLSSRVPKERGSAQIRAWVSPQGAVVRVDVFASDLSDRGRILLIEEARKLRFEPGAKRIVLGMITLS